MASAGLAAGLALAAGGDPPIRALHWLAKDADLGRAITTQPTECLRLPADAAEALKVEVGRAAFRTPVLLGGQAARASLACETCHRNGRTNPDFHFPGVSGAPGTADVTDELFSSHRGDRIFDPKPIPDLSGPKARLKVSQDPADPRLRSFIHGLITEEFDGPEPPPAVLEGLAAYVRALDPAACPAAAREPVDVAGFMADARRAVTAARGEIAGGHPDAAVTMLASARARLGLIDERFADARFAGQQAQLQASSEHLAAAQATLRRGGPSPDAALAQWLKSSYALERTLTAAQPGSLFEIAKLREAAAASSSPASAAGGGPPAERSEERVVEGAGRVR